MGSVFQSLVACGLLACPAAHAQNVTWIAPSGGFVFDSQAGAIRPISGFVGAAFAGPAVISGLEWASISPNQKSAFVYSAASLQFVADLNSAAQSQSLAWLADARQAVWAADSTAAVVLTRESLIWLSILPSGVSVLRTVHIAALVRDAGRVGFSAPSVMAVDRQANLVLLSSGNVSQSRLWIASPGSSPKALPFAGQAAAAAFAYSSSSLFIADSLNHSLVRVNNPANSPSVVLIATSPEQLGAPVGIALSDDDARIFAADRITGIVSEFDATSGSLLNTLSADAVAQRVVPFTPGRFLLDPAQSSSPFLFLDTAVPARITFVPRSN